MNSRRVSLSLLTGALFGLPVSSFAARVTSDVHPPQKRQATLANAERLVQRKGPPPLPADLVSPFNPTDFDKPDPADVQANIPQAGTRPNGQSSAAVAAAPATDRSTLETLAAQIIPSGMIERRGAPRLLIGNKPFEVGTRFTATYNNQDFELELVAIDRTTFTLRYRSEEITRPIKPVR